MDESRSAALQAAFPSLFAAPIDVALEVLATEPRIDIEALGACLVRPDECGPALLNLLERAADGEALSEEEETLLFRGLHVLAGARNERTFRPLLRFLHRPEDELDRLLGDAITETLSRVLASVFDGDADALLALAADRSCDEYVRDAALGAATYLAWAERIDRGLLADFLVRFHAERLADDGDYAWIAWQQCIALLGFETLAPLVRDAWPRMPELVMTLADFEGDLAAALRDPADDRRFHLNRLGYIDDVYEAIAWTDRDDEENPEGVWDAGREGSAPATNPFRNVGRNDPCPCGSGKKAKRCCLAAS